MSTDVRLLAARAREFEADARDAFDLGRAVDHRVDRFFHAVDGALLLRRAEVDAAGQFAHDHEIETAHELGLQGRRILEPGKHPDRAQVRVQLVVAPQQKERVFRTLRERLSFVFGQSDAAEENRRAALADRARRIRQRRQALRERRAADRRFDAFDVGTHRTQHGGAPRA